LGFDLNFAEGENSLDDAFDTTWPCRDKRSIEDPAGGRPKVDSGRDEVQDFDIYGVSLSSSGCD
jgi:hypothetical protein